MNLILPAFLALLSPQDDPNTTVVTARKIEEDVDRVPGSVTVIDGADLADAQVRSVEEAVAGIPNMRLTEFSSRRLSLPYIRGVGSGQGEPAVTTVIDGVPQLTSSSANLPLVGLDRIEVLRGPQGALYGRNTLGGVMNMVTRRPGSTPSSFAGLTIGDHDLLEFEASFSGPFGDDKGLTLDFLQSKRSGYTTNTITGNDVDDRNGLFGRAQLYMNPSDDSELRIGVYAEHARDGGFVLAPLTSLKANPHEISQDFEGVAERDVISPSVVYEKFGADHTLTSITSFTDWEVLETSDFDFTAIDGIRRETAEDQSYFYQELRLTSAEDGAAEGTQMRWLAGASLFAADSGRSATNDFRPGGAGIFFPPANVGIDANTGSFDDLGIGLFGQMAWMFDSGLEIAAGLRYDREEKDADLNQQFLVGGFPVLDVDRDFDDDFDQISPSLSLRHPAGERGTVYASAAKAFKAGGFNLTAPTGGFIFDPEEAWAYELGYKHNFDCGANLRIAAYQIDWTDMQLSLFDPMAGGYIDNVGESQSAGLEIEYTTPVADEWDAFASLGISDTEIDEYTDGFALDNSGNSLPFAPDTTLAVGAQYTTDLKEDLQFVLRTTYQSVGDFYYDASNLGEESYELLDVRAGLRHGDWSLDFFLRNALDEEYFPVAFQANPLDPSQFMAETGAPRTLGFSLRFSF